MLPTKPSPAPPSSNNSNPSTSSFFIVIEFVRPSSSPERISSFLIDHNITGFSINPGHGPLGSCLIISLPAGVPSTLLKDFVTFFYKSPAKHFLTLPPTYKPFAGHSSPSVDLSRPSTIPSGPVSVQAPSSKVSLDDPISALPKAFSDALRKMRPSSPFAGPVAPPLHAPSASPSAPVALASSPPSSVPPPASASLGSGDSCPPAVHVPFVPLGPVPDAPRLDNVRRQPPSVPQPGLPRSPPCSPLLGPAPRTLPRPQPSAFAASSRSRLDMKTPLLNLPSHLSSFCSPPFLGSTFLPHGFYVLFSGFVCFLSFLSLILPSLFRFPVSSSWSPHRRFSSL